MFCPEVGGAVASWLVRLTLERVVLVQALAWNIVLCSWVRHFNFTNLILGVTLRWTSIPSRRE